jgi:hypothetical protein
MRLTDAFPAVFPAGIRCQEVALGDSRQGHARKFLVVLQKVGCDATMAVDSAIKSYRYIDGPHYLFRIFSRFDPPFFRH